MRRQEQKEQEVEKIRDEHFNKYRPMVPQGKEWRTKPAIQSVGPVEPPQATGMTDAGDRSDRKEQPIRPVQPVVEQKVEATTSALHDEFQQFLRLWVMRNWWTMRLLWRTTIWR